MTRALARGCALAALLLAALLLAALPAAGTAQRPVPTRPRLPAVRPDTLRRPAAKPGTTRPPAGTPADSAARDLGPDAPAGADTGRAPLVEWAEPDSAMQELLDRPGYSVTRYQGARATFDAENRTIYLVGGEGRAAVGRAQTVLVSDTILYNDSTQVVRAQGDTNVLRDPSRGSDDLVSYGHLVYNIGERRGAVRNVRTSMPNGGQTWVVEGENAAFVTDSGSTDNAAFYARGGSVTSCTDTVPHYHFESREIKLVRNRVLVSRPAVLYIYDVPVMWLPFVFQDLRSGRRSGMLTPRFGVSELFRTSPTYRRHFENLGYYWAISDYMDAQLALDWRSDARPDPQNPDDRGFMRYNGEWRYRWLDRFMTGRLAASYLQLRNGATNTSASWAHQQDFSQRSHLTADVNYVTSTQVYRANIINPYQALATVQSRLNLQQQIGPASFSLGGSRKQYPGRDQVDQELPNLSVSTQPINAGQWLTWTPTFSLNNAESRDIDQLGASAFRYVPRTDGGIDSVRLKRGQRNTSARFDTPIKIFGFNWRNSFSYQDAENDFPETRVVESVVSLPGGGTDTLRSQRVFARTYQTGMDWQTGIDLPSLFQGTWNLTPSVQIVNVDQSAPYVIRTERTGEKFVQQRKRLQYALSTSPTFFGLFPGLGPISRLRHSITPSLSYSYAPEAKVNDEFLAARGEFRGNYLGNIGQNALSLTLVQNIEAKLRSESDTAPEGGRKVRLLSINPSGFTYNFERLAEIRRRLGGDTASVEWWQGLETDRFNYSLSSDLLPGFSFQSGYSLFQGDTRSDTAVFKPYRESVSASFSINRRSGIFALIGRVFGRPVPLDEPGDVKTTTSTTAPDDDSQFAQQVASQPVAGSESRNAQFNVPTGEGFQASLTLSSTRQRPVTGNNVLAYSPEQLCAALRESVIPGIYDQCVSNPGQFPSITGITPGTDNSFANQTTRGGPIYRSPPQTTIGAQTSFNITPKWAAQWSTSYDVRQKEFASHVVTLQRELHDWRAIFSFTQAPNGAFAFTFFISLNAQPDLKFNYDRRSLGRRAGSSF